jgi:hypothetical protein
MTGKCTTGKIFWNFGELAYELLECSLALCATVTWLAYARMRLTSGTEIPAFCRVALNSGETHRLYPDEMGNRNCLLLSLINQINVDFSRVYDIFIL